MSKEKIDYWKGLLKKGQDNKAREQGRYEMLMKRLKDEFEHDSLEDLEAEIVQVEAELAESKVTLARMMEDFENEHLANLEAAARQS